jgi:hypothetical protein
MGDSLKVAVIATGIGEGVRAAAPKPAREETPYVLSKHIETFASFPEEDKKEEPIMAPSPAVGESNLDNYFTSGGDDDIQSFIEEEAEKFRKSTELRVEPEDKGGDDEPEPPKGGKKNPLSDFFSMLGKESDDNFFEDAEKLDVDKMSAAVELAPAASRSDNVVFLAGSLSEKEKDGKQIDLMEMLRKMEETLEIPAIFKK